MTDACPNCGDNGNFNGVHCRECGFGRLSSMIKNEPNIELQNERLALIQRMEGQLRSHPISTRWGSGRIKNIADLCVTLGFKDASTWFEKGPYVKHVSGYGGPKDNPPDSSNLSE